MDFSFFLCVIKIKSRVSSDEVGFMFIVCQRRNSFFGVYWSELSNSTTCILGCLAWPKNVSLHSPCQSGPFYNFGLHVELKRYAKLFNSQWLTLHSNAGTILNYPRCQHFLNLHWNPGMKVWAFPCTIQFLPIIFSLQTSKIKTHALSVLHELHSIRNGFAGFYWNTVSLVRKTRFS